MEAGWEFVVKQVDDLNPGVSYRKLAKGNDVLVVYGGWGVRNDGARAWADALVAAPGAPVLGSLGHAFAVRGPVDASDKTIENALKNSEIVKRLMTQGAVGRLYVIAHSSGSKFLREFLGQIGKARIAATVKGWNLDGFALHDPRIKEIARPGHGKRAHMQLVNTTSTLDVLSREAVNRDYLRVTPITVCTSYLGE